jgi:hypothetical protein
MKKKIIYILLFSLPVILFLVRYQVVFVKKSNVNGIHDNAITIISREKMVQLDKTNTTYVIVKDHETKEVYVRELLRKKDGKISLRESVNSTERSIDLKDKQELHSIVFYFNFK